MNKFFDYLDSSNEFLRENRIYFDVFFSLFVLYSIFSLIFQFPSERTEFGRFLSIMIILTSLSSLKRVWVQFWVYLKKLSKDYEDELIGDVEDF